MRSWQNAILKMTDAMDAMTALAEKYDKRPAEGLRRFWMNVDTWSEGWEDDEFFTFVTGSGMYCKLRPSIKGTPEAANLPESSNGFATGLDDDEFERLYVGHASVCMLVDAENESAAWAAVRRKFPDAIECFIKPADEKTLTSLGRGGRFGHPCPHADEWPEGAPAP